MTMIYPNLCYNMVCYKGATLYIFYSPVSIYFHVLQVRIFKEYCISSLNDYFYHGSKNSADPEEQVILLVKISIYISCMKLIELRLKAQSIIFQSCRDSLKEGDMKEECDRLNGKAASSEANFILSTSQI